MADGHGRAAAPDAVVPWRTFAAVGAFVAVLAAIYWFTSYEEAGTALLVLASALSLWSAAYLRRHGASPPDDDEAETAYLPHESVWPFVIGLGVFLALNGLLVGGWFFVPGVAVLALGLAGWLRQSRARS